VQRRHHYEQAFEEYLRQRRVPYVAVDEAKKALLPESASLRVHRTTDDQNADETASDSERALKSFDLVVYGESEHLLVEVKGRKIAPRALRGKRAPNPERAQGRPKTRLENWATEDDVWSLGVWESLFGHGFVAVLVFIYWCDEQPPAPLFEEIFEFHGRWYAVRAVRVQEYARAMRPRSSRWRTVHLPQSEFDRISGPLCGVLP
jgi:hypothetical protein